jgi:predicted 3-demethylubiquinone-9 3-methyltransferase (glyoxalase superfamily)
MMSTPMSGNQKITPHLWFNRDAEEAANFYVSTFSAVGGLSKVGHVSYYSEAAAEVSGIPTGTVMTVEFALGGLWFIALNGGPAFGFTPAISFFVHGETAEEVDALWEKLSAGGETLMPMDSYPFAERYGWLKDKYGVSWQIILASSEQKIMPALLFVGEQFGRAEEAMNLYTSLFQDSGIGVVSRYGPEMADHEGAVAHGTFTLAGQGFVAMDSGIEHDFTFTEATSLLVNCESQEEVDRLWEQLTDGGEEQPCGWLKDRFGVSWQIVPTRLMELLADEDDEKVERVTQAFLQMKKIEIADLEAASTSGNL